MQTRTFAIVVIAAFILTSCIDITEEVFLNKKGTGKYSLAIDLSSLMDMGMMADMMKDMDLGQEEGEEDIHFEDSVDLFGEMEEKMDTIMRFDNLPDSIRQKISKPGILKKGYMRIQMDKAESLMLMSFHVDFDKFSDIEDFFTAFEEIKGEQDPSGGILGESDDFMKGGLFSLSKRVLSRLPTPKQTSDTAGLFDGEEGEFAKMMFEGAKYKTIYHLPGKVKSTTIPNAVVNGKVVTVENDMLAVMEEKATMHGEIKFKRK